MQSFIDHFVVSENIVENIVSGIIAESGVSLSDHCAVCLDMNVRVGFNNVRISRHAACPQYSD